MKKNVWIFGSLFAILLAGAITLTALVLHKPVEPADKPVQTVQGQPEQSDVEPAPKTGQNSVDLRDIDYTPQYPKHDSNVPNDDQPNENQTSDQVPDQPGTPDGPTVDPALTPDPRDSTFAALLLKECFEENKNVCLSPFSLEMALALTANGAQGETRAQIERLIGVGGKNTEQITAELKELCARLSESGNVSIANSVWIREALLDVSPAYLQTVQDAFNADVLPLTAVDPVNQWVMKKTDGMIKEIMKELPDETACILINAVLFDAKWAEPYEEKQVQPDVFHTADGKEQPVEMMHCFDTGYLEDSLATGFYKSYTQCPFAFAVIVPKDGITLEDYVAQMEDLSILHSRWSLERIGAESYLPKFSFDYGESLKDPLIRMGIKDAFETGAADFSALGQLKTGNPLFVGDVTQNTRIEVGEEGTRAAAVTAVHLASGGGPEEFRIVKADRPFLFVIYDWKTDTPVFLGAVNDLG